MRKWFLGIFPQVRCGCILEPELLNGERVSVLTTQSNNVVVVGGSFFKGLLCEEVLCAPAWANAWGSV